MADEAGFQIVSRKKRRKRGKVKTNSQQSTNDIGNNSDYCDTERIIAQIGLYREEIQASSFYTELKDLFSRPTKNGQNKDTNNEEPKVQSSTNIENKLVLFHDIVCYGVGCIRTCPNARYQFALLILLKEFLKVSSVCIYEPLFNEDDKVIVKHFGCSLIEENEDVYAASYRKFSRMLYQVMYKCIEALLPLPACFYLREAKRSVSQPTLFYMPHCSKLLYNNVLWANWGPSLKNVVIFGNGFSSYEHRMPSHQLFSQVMYIAKILPHTTEVDVPNSFHLKDIFNDSSLHFFTPSTLDTLPKDFWSPCPEPSHDRNDPEIVTKQRE